MLRVHRLHTFPDTHFVDANGALVHARPGQLAAGLRIMSTLIPLRRGTAAFGLPGVRLGGYELDFSYLLSQPAPLLLETASNPGGCGCRDSHAQKDDTMTNNPWRCLLRPLALVALASATWSQSPSPGLRLYGSVSTLDIKLVDNSGVAVHTWQTRFRPGLGIDLLSDGTLLRAIQDPGTGQGRKIGGAGGGVQRHAYDSTVLWNFRYNQGGVLNHHDIEPLLNGNVLLIAWEEKTNAEAIAQGRRPNLLGPVPYFLPDHVVEVQPTGPNSGTIVWEWHIWDHLIQDHDPTKANFGVVANHPELLDINYPAEIYTAGDFNHANGIDYDPIHDWIVISALRQSEIWIIDHSTTTAEAAGHTGGRWGKGGDLLYRWGNPEAYRAGPASARQLGRQHAPRFIPPGYPGAGNLTVFNNQFTPTQSAVFELVLPLDAAGNFILPPGGAYGPAGPLWTYTTPNLYSFVMSSAQRMPNGNTLVCSADQEWVFEVTPSGQKVWEVFENEGRPIFHAHYVERSLWKALTNCPPRWEAGSTSTCCRARREAATRTCCCARRRA